VSLARTAPAICWRDRQEVRSEDQGTKERSGLFHSWYTDPSLQGKGEQCNSQVSHHRPRRGREPCQRLGQGKIGRQRGTATNQWIKEALWTRKTPRCMNRDAGSRQRSLDRPSCLHVTASAVGLKRRRAADLRLTTLRSCVRRADQPTLAAHTAAHQV